MGMLINDSKLIRFLIDEYRNISFFSSGTVKTYIKDIEKIYLSANRTEKKDLLRHIFNPSKKHSINVLDFWERLLIDSIKYLKWHDLSELPLNRHKGKRRPRNKTEKQEVYNKITESSLGVYNLKDYFKQFISFERLLYGAEQFYRDHVYHLIRVWLIGQYILSKKINAKDKFGIEINESDYKFTDYKKQYKNDPKIYTSKHILKSSKNPDLYYEGEEDAIWCLIALTHDLGYPLSKVEDINVSIKKMMQYFAKTGLEEFSFSFPQQNQFINDALLEYISSKIIEYRKHEKYETHIQAKYYLKFARSFELFKHGLISSIVLAKNIIFFLESNFDHNPNSYITDQEEARQFIIRREILRAIASHTCPEIYHFKPNTFSFLLLFADELQSWGRPNFESMAMNIDNDFEVRLHEFSDTIVSFNIRSKKTKDTKNLKKESLMGYFLSKVEFFKKILRVAVDSSDRIFEFVFTLEDDTKTKYKFTAKPLEKPIMTINREPIDHNEMQKLTPLHKKGIKKKFKELQDFNDKYKLSRSPLL